jgi:O-antigen/teichoic acid export membrane protein
VRRLAFNATILALGSYMAAGASALTYLLAARTLGPAVFGSLSGAIGIAIVLGAFGDFGINGWAIRALARNPTSTDVFSRTLTAKIALAIVVALAWVAVALATLRGSSLDLAVGILGPYVATVIVAGTLMVPFRASERMGMVSVITAVERTVALGVWLIIQVSGRIEPASLPIALLVGGIASVACAAALIPRHLLAISTPSVNQLVALWRSSYSFGMVGVSTQLLRADVAIVAAAAGPFAAGVYAAPARLTALLTVIPQSFSAAAFPRIARSSSTGTSRRPELIGALAMFALMILLLAGVAWAAPAVVPLVLGKAYVGSVDVLRIILFVALVNSANQPLLALLQAAGLEHYAGRSVIATVAVGLMAIAVGARVGGAQGAATGALLMQVTQFIFFASKALRMPERLVSSPFRGPGSDEDPLPLLGPTEASSDIGL